MSAYEGLAGQEIAAWNTIDVRASWSAESGPFAGLHLALSVQNLTDEDPPFYDSPAGDGFDAAQASVLGRTIALQMIKRW